MYLINAKGWKLYDNEYSEYSVTTPSILDLFNLSFINLEEDIKHKEWKRQAGAEPGQAQPKLGLRLANVEI